MLRREKTTGNGQTTGDSRAQESHWTWKEETSGDLWRLQSHVCMLWLTLLTQFLS